MKGATKEAGRNGQKRSLFFTHVGMMIILSVSAIVSLQTAEAGTKVERRGFKSSLLSTARGFGKRSSLIERGIRPTTAINFGKRGFFKQHLRNDFPVELSSLEGSPATSQYYRNSRPSPPNQQYDMATLLHQLTEEAARNPRFLPLLLEFLSAETDAHNSSLDEENAELSSEYLERQ